MRALARDFGGENPLDVTFVAPAAVPSLAPDAELAIYRTLQEALANSVRHGQCSHVEVTLSVDGDTASLEVVDDGVGFPTDNAGVLDRTRGGLAGIRERITGVGGAFTLENDEAGGARVVVRVPLAAEVLEERR
jgi:two-component system sensor histidine kinase UhpB